MGFGQCTPSALRVEVSRYLAIRDSGALSKKLNLQHSELSYTGGHSKSFPHVMDYLQPGQDMPEWHRQKHPDTQHCTLQTTDSKSIVLSTT